MDKWHAAHRVPYARGNAVCERLAIFFWTYWAAMIVNMSFDVCLEGPMLAPQPAE
jgi:hypothetical protein